MPNKAVARDGVARLLDANLNRAREGLRVIEDTARFVWADAALYKRIRAIRHELHAVSAKSYKFLVSARESGDDAGRKLKEGPRSSLSAVVGSNIRRAEEAVRVLEEYSKFLSQQAAPAFKRIRYRLYTLEKDLVKKI
jgi:thiamine-phosphate pyrophosphorylase